MSKSQKMPNYIKSYIIRIALFISAYMVILPAGIWLKHTGTMSQGIAPVFAVLSALPICGVFWTIFRLLTEVKDEYQRLLFTKQILLGTAWALTIVIFWEFLNVYGVTTVPPSWTTVIWFMTFGLAGGYVRWRA